MSTEYTKLSAISDLSAYTLDKTPRSSYKYGESPYNFNQFSNLSIEVSYTKNNVKHSSKLSLFELMSFLSGCIYNLSASPYVRLSNETRELSIAPGDADGGWTEAPLYEFLTKNDSRKNSVFLRVDGEDAGGNQPYVRLNNENRTIQTNSTLNINSTSQITLTSPTIELSTARNKLQLNNSGTTLTSNAKISCSTSGGNTTGIVLATAGSNNGGININTEGDTNQGVKITTKTSSNQGIVLQTSDTNNKGVKISTTNTEDNAGIYLSHNSNYGKINIVSETNNPSNTGTEGIAIRTNKQPILINSGDKVVEVRNSYNTGSVKNNIINGVATAAIWN